MNILAKKEPVKKHLPKVVEEDNTKSPEVLDIDLIKDEIPVIFDKQKYMRMLWWFVGLAVVFVALVYLALYLWEAQEIKKKSDALSSEISKLDGEIASYREQAVLASILKDRGESIAPIVGRHIYWNNFFKFLEKNTLANVYYSGFSGDVSGKYVLHATVDDFRATSFQIKSFIADSHTESAKITNEEMIDGSDGERTSEIFDLNLSVKPSLFNE
jgi:hypothetical protein